MENKVKVSIIMPAYNTEEYISSAIDSVINQTISDWELLIVDDGSTDNTGNIIDSYVNKDKRIRVFHIENKGVSNARNIGLDEAKGDWIAFLDSDDMLTENALEKLLSSSNNMDLVIGNYKEYPSMKQKMFLNDVIDISVTDLVRPTVIVGAAWGMIFKRTSIKERFPLDLQGGEDSIFLYGQLRYCPHISIISDVVYLYRRDNIQSLTHQKNINGYDFIDRFVEILIELVKDSLDIDLISYIAHIFVKYAELIVGDNTLTKSKKIELLNKIFTNKNLLDLPLRQLKLTTHEMRVFTLLKTGDMSLIEKEFNIENN